MYSGGGTTIRGGVKTYGRHGFTPQDIEASEILLSLRNLICPSESRFRVSVKWGRKRKRSAIGSGPPPLLAPEILQKKVKASSPATPLSYPPSESDDKPMDRVRKISKKQTREELKNTVNELEKEQHLLRRELEIVCGRRNGLVACNAYFKAKQLELIHGVKFPGTETPVELVMEKQEMTHKNQMSGLVFPSFVGPVRIPDLNMTVEDVSRPLDCLMNIKDFKSAAAADARRKRMLRMKEKMKKSLISVKISSRC